MHATGELGFEAGALPHQSIMKSVKMNRRCCHLLSVPILLITAFRIHLFSAGNSPISRSAESMLPTWPGFTTACESPPWCPIPFKPTIQNKHELNERESMGGRAVSHQARAQTKLLRLFRRACPTSPVSIVRIMALFVMAHLVFAVKKMSLHRPAQTNSAQEHTHTQKHTHLRLVSCSTFPPSKFGPT